MYSDTNTTRSVADAVMKVMNEKLHPNQQKLDVHEPEKDELTAKDFEMLRAKKAVKKEEVEQIDEVVRIFHHTADWASPSRNAKNPNDAAAVAHRKAAADAAKTARAGGNFKFKGNAQATPLTPKSSGGNVQAVKSEEVDQVQEVAPPGFEGTVKAMKKYKKIDNPFALAWSMKNKGYKSHKKADGSDK